MRDHQQRAFYSTLGLAILVTLGWGLSAGGAEGLAFALFTVLTLGGSAMCIWERSVVRSAFCLMGTFMGVAGFFLLLGNDFLAMAQILIYVGGILVLILFGVMLSPPDEHERKLSRVGWAVVLLGGGVAYLVSQVAGRATTWVMADELGEPTTRAREIGIAFLDPQQYVVAFELAAFLLTVALVAAVYIARRRRADFLPEQEGGA